MAGAIEITRNQDIPTILDEIIAILHSDKLKVATLYKVGKF